MIDALMYIITALFGLFTLHQINDAIDSYKEMKKAKQKAMIWDARIK